MSDERTTTLSAEEVAELVEERRAAKWKTRQRLFGSTVVGLFGMGKMATVPGPASPDTGVMGLGVSGAEVFWVAVVLIAFGVATIGEVSKALGRGQ